MFAYNVIVREGAPRQVYIPAVAISYLLGACTIHIITVAGKVSSTKTLFCTQCQK